MQWLKANSEAVVSIVLVFLLVLFLDPLMIWMPGALTYCALAAAVILFAVFAGLVWREQAADEREQLHAMVGSRAGFIAGASVLILGIGYQTLVIHTVDTWLLLALGALILGKVGGLLYGKSRL